MQEKLEKRSDGCDSLMHKEFYSFVPVSCQKKAVISLWKMMQISRIHLHLFYTKNISEPSYLTYLDLKSYLLMIWDYMRDLRVCRGSSKSLLKVYQNYVECLLSVYQEPAFLIFFLSFLLKLTVNQTWNFFGKKQKPTWYQCVILSIWLFKFHQRVRINQDENKKL